MLNFLKYSIIKIIYIPILGKKKNKTLLFSDMVVKHTDKLFVINNDVSNFNLLNFLINIRDGYKLQGFSK